MRGAEGKLVPIRELVTGSDSQREQPAFHKNWLALNHVVADRAGQLDSPLYGMFALRGELARIATADSGPRAGRFITPPTTPGAATR